MPAPPLSVTYHDAPNDGQIYGRQSYAWIPISPISIVDAPQDGNLYVRQNGAWVALPVGGARLHAASTTLNNLVNGFLKFDTLDFDTSGYSSGGAPYNRLAVPTGKGGLYIISAHCDTASSGASSSQSASIMINGTTVVGNNNARVSGTNGASINVVALWQLKPADYVQLQYQDSAPNSSGQFTAGVSGPSLAMALIG